MLAEIAIFRTVCLNYFITNSNQNGCMDCIIKNIENFKLLFTNQNHTSQVRIIIHPNAMHLKNNSMDLKREGKTKNEKQNQ